jgi:hypothetical protein
MQPTEAQIEAGNYRKNHRRFCGLDITVENAAGSIRSGTDDDGKPWAITMLHDYGYIKRTEGADGEQVDCYVGPDEGCTHVYVVHQNDPETGMYDEDKCMIGFDSEDSARAAYLAHYDRPGFLGSVSPIPIDTFKGMLHDDTGAAIPLKWKHKQHFFRDTVGVLDFSHTLPELQRLGDLLEKQQRWLEAFSASMDRMMFDADFERLHPRKDDGEFTPKGGGSASSGKKTAYAPTNATTGKPIGQRTIKIPGGSMVVEKPNAAAMSILKNAPGRKMYEGMMPSLTVKPPKSGWSYKVPAIKPIKAPPWPKTNTKPGKHKFGRSSVKGMTNVQLEAAAMNLVKKLGIRPIQPAGVNQYPLDAMYGDSGLAFEIKVVSTHSSEYKAKPKADEVAIKRAFAAHHGLKPMTMLLVYDPDKGKAHAYYREGIVSGRLSPTNLTNWNFLGAA